MLKIRARKRTKNRKAINAYLRWLEDVPEFQDALNRAEKQALDAFADLMVFGTATIWRKDNG